MSSTAQQRVMDTLMCIPVGRVASYGQIADLAGLPGRARLVGKVLRDAPADAQLPWHRVLRASGQLAFQSGSQQAKLQAALLAQEGVVVERNKVSMKTFGWRPTLADILFQLTE
jgi:methylated-DNA-protein-cysteine methyltransferase-like protein